MLSSLAWIGLCLAIPRVDGPYAAWAQEPVRTAPTAPGAAAPAAISPLAGFPGTTSPGSGTAALEPRVVPRAFRGIELGMDMEAVKAALSSDGLFSYRGEPDVSLLPRPDESLIEVSGMSFVKRAFFQFYEGKLFVMILALNEKEMDHYSVYTSLSIKYGKPDTLSPSESVWADEATRLSIERPLAVKYIDLAVFNALKAAGAAQQSYGEVLRQEFLGGFQQPRPVSGLVCSQPRSVAAGAGAPPPSRAPAP